MQEVLVGISAHPGERAPVECDGDCRRLVAILEGRAPFCIKHRRRVGTLRALVRRKLVEPLTVVDDTQQTLWDMPPTKPTHYQLTELGRRTASLARLGRKAKKTR